MRPKCNVITRPPLLPITEPMPVAETFTFKDEATGVSLSDVASLHNLVTVVDAASIFEQLKTMDTLVDSGWQA